MHNRNTRDPVGGINPADPANPRPDNVIFFFSLEPRKILTMMDGLERKDLNEKELAQMEENIKKMTDDPQSIIVSPMRLQKMNMKVGERIKASSIFQKDVNFDFTIVGTLPDGKFEGVAMMSLRDGKIAEYREVANVGPAFVELGFAPERVSKILAKEGKHLKAQPDFKRHVA